MIYLQINFFLCLLWSVIIKLLPLKEEMQKKVFVSLTFVQLLIVHGLCDIQLGDLPVYEKVWNSLQYSSFSQFINSSSIIANANISEGIEGGFIFFMRLVNFFTDNFRWFIFINSFLMLICYYNVFFKYSTNIYISVLLLLLLPFNQSLFVIRQHLSIAVLLLSYPYIINRKLYKFLLIVFIAFILHNSSLIFIPIYFLYGIKSYKKYISVVILTTVFFLFLFKYIFSLIGYNIDRYVGYTFFTSFASSIKALTMLTILIIYILFLKKEIFREGMNKLILTSSLIGILGGIFLGEMGAGRIFLIYNLCVLFQIPLTMKYINNRLFRYVYIILALSLYFAFTFYFSTDSIYIEDYKINL